MVSLGQDSHFRPRHMRILYPFGLEAPVSKLPVELLGEIFSWTLGDWGAMTDEPSALVLEPLILSHVCGYWRSVLLSIPMLWATIWIDRPKVAHIDMVKLWIERSRNCLLSINLRQTDPKSCLPDEHRARFDG
ncbi:hypothetical protein DFH09DRAFT_357603 [Mycena vulgaris]|nr:hypothetical protein DFH09DRAFT_357603 [Mycena vulgaris]